MRRILVGTAEPSLSQQLGQVLGQLGSQAQVFPTAEGLAAGLREGGADLVLVDRRLPSLSLADLLRPLDGGSLGWEVPVVLLGEFANPCEQMDLMDQGIAEFIQLPAESGFLAVRLRAVLRLIHRIDQMRARALIDELTGVFNRRYLEGHLSAKFGEAKRYRHPFSFILLDLDHFKQVNDTLGHQFGDLVLRQTAGLIRSQMRGEDMLTRYGGEEFAIILPHTDLEGALILAERVRLSVAEYCFVQGENQIQITVSLGVAAYPENDFSNTSDLIECVDSRLYRAKESGRNCFVFR